ncbi:hypothetical protein Ctaglu_02510 [Clostridium tagluense]|uniref:Uncharacterized protein n=1 Tax=Clostridium tagluense TaxID=360422 RepID=A0A401UGG4_9CLOT|nr:hypothetical protein Ctaglu_02510 [Clostridium tagluense]
MLKYSYRHFLYSPYISSFFININNIFISKKRHKFNLTNAFFFTYKYFFYLLKTFSIAFEIIASSVKYGNVI